MPPPGQHRTRATDIGAGPRQGVRADIEGLRAVAVTAVLAFHAGILQLAGGFVGVDVFFVLSGFLITGLLARELAQTGRVRLGRFWARRARRLLPASAVVLVFSAFVTYVWLPVTQRGDFGGDIVAAALYVVNWRLADRSVDYLAEDIGASPVQHYWSLAVEEQFYIVWPIVLLLIGVLMVRRWRAGALTVLVLVTAASFVWSVHQSIDDPSTGFFVSTTRVWELGVGGLLALTIGAVRRIHPRIRAVGGWAGLAAIAAAVVLFDGDTTWPGVPALLPVLGTALVIAAGGDGTPGLLQRALGVRPMVWIGGLSYSLYLWHWPLVVAAQARYPDLQVRWLVLVTIASIIPAWLCHRFVENPIRFGRPFRATVPALGLGATLTAAGVVTGVVLGSSLLAADEPPEAALSQTPGGAVLATPTGQSTVWSDVQSVDHIRPLPSDAKRDRPANYDEQPECQVRAGDSEPHPCTFGDPDGDRTVVIVGDSKMAQWEPALAQIASDQGWKLVQMTKSACPFADHVRGADTDKDCRAWGAATLDLIVDLDPDLVISSQRHGLAFEDGTTTLTREAMVDGVAAYWGRIAAAGIPLVTLLDNPSPPTQTVYDCVAQNPEQLSRCAFDKAPAVESSAAKTQRAAAKQVAGTGVVDMTDLVCPDDDRCAAVIGDVLIYRQGSHLTATYVDTLRPALSARLAEATDGLLGRS